MLKSRNQFWKYLAESDNKMEILKILFSRYDFLGRGYKFFRVLYCYNNFTFDVASIWLISQELSPGIYDFMIFRLDGAVNCLSRLTQFFVCSHLPKFR